MARTWRFSDLVDELKFIYNFNEGQSDQDMRGPSTDPDKRFRDAINEAYVDEVEEAAQMGASVYFITQTFLSWAASAPTLDIGDDLAGATIQRIDYRAASASSTAPWELLWLSSWPEDANHYWLDRRTLQWACSGPTTAQTLRFVHIAEPAEMQDDFDEPVLIPRRFRHLLPVSAAIKLRMVADDEMNNPLVRRRNEIRERFWKAISQGRPTLTGYPGTLSASDGYGMVP